MTLQIQKKLAAIVGVAESDEIGRVPNKSSLQHHAEAAYNAIKVAGLKISDVDGLFTAGFSTLPVSYTHLTLPTILLV